MTIAHSRAIDRLRSGKSRRLLEEPLEECHWVSTVGDTPESLSVREQMMRRVQAALAQLAAEQAPGD